MASASSKDQKEQIRLAAEADLLTFIRLVAPHRVLGAVHKDLIRWWTRDEAKTHQMALLPRDHQKSQMIAYRVAWEITKWPAVTVFYVSSTSALAEKQLKAIGDILESPKYRTYWPKMVEKEKGKRSKWSATEIEVDHPMRELEVVRDPTVFTGGLTTSRTGFHCNIAVLDDVVVQENAYTREGRDKVEAQYSLLASIETTMAREWVVGTRYHPDDLYGKLIEKNIVHYDEFGQVASKEPLYEVYQKEVEDNGDGTGEYLWPRQMRADGQWFGFNAEVLATKRAQYLDQTQFRAQYYNNPNDPDNEAISRDLFQYYDRKYLEKRQGVWTMQGRPLRLFAAIDFAFSLGSKSDYTALVVIGVDAENNYYVVDILRFRTNKITEYYDAIFKMHVKWGFRKIRAEVNVAQEVIVENLKDRIRESGNALSIDKHRPMRQSGTKEERVAAILGPRYENGQVWHYEGGLCQELEEELVAGKPKHDDIKDALANAIDIAVPPTALRERVKNKVVYHSRFGGVAA